MRRWIENLAFSIVISLIMMGAARLMFPPPPPDALCAWLGERYKAQRIELDALNKVAAEVQRRAAKQPEALPYCAQRRHK